MVSFTMRKQDTAIALMLLRSLIPEESAKHAMWTGVQVARQDRLMSARNVKTVLPILKEGYASVRSLLMYLISCQCALLLWQLRWPAINCKPRDNMKSNGPHP